MLRYGLLGDRYFDDGPPLDFFNATALLLDISLDPPVISGIEAGVECLEESVPKLLPKAHLLTHKHLSTKSQKSDSSVSESEIQDQPSSSLLNMPMPDNYANPYVPETSYSSSEDEDFFDAEDTKSRSAALEINDGLCLEKSDEISVISNSVNNLSLAETIDMDAIYEDDEEEDLGSVESHGSVISHLLSQVRIGMDLTKVVLPTFILERRSLLEMYADFFAHPDLFVSIPDEKDTRQRMVQVMRWYLSAFHAGRKSSVAKKPYNPIIGEVFKCHWDIPGMENLTSKLQEGTLPWATEGQLCFTAEQVSHHPPISAFYAEHFGKRISLDAHIWTKSKFFGLSIGVIMLGQGCISLPDYDEEYIVTFPNGYGRSILTIPWIELGGTTSVTCAKTGYSASVEFQTKPFYGGKKHRLVADVYGPNEKKAFLSVSGEWNGVMNAKWADGRSEVFVDTTTMTVIKKKVRPVVDQEPNESRRLWADVTAGLKFRNIEKATKAKYQLEQKQRMEALGRKEKQTLWDPKIFQEAGEGWIYNNPLHKRLNSTICQS